MYEAELRFANEVADRAAAIAMDMFQGTFEVREKPDLTPVTEADLRIEAMALEALTQRFPGDALLGEEEGLKGESSRVWILDPIDGTKNFAAGIHVWGTLLALQTDDDVVLGIVSAPALGERYSAVRGAGARVNGEPIHVSSASTVAQGMVLVGDAEGLLGTERERAYLDLLRDAKRTRGFGDFWAHALVARGAAEVALEPELRIWDWAALSVILEEAGGRMTQLDGNALADRGSALSTNGLVHEEVVGRLAVGYAADR